MGAKLQIQLEGGEQGDQAEETSTFQLRILENMNNQMLQAKDNGNKRKTIKYKANVKKKIDEKNQLITKLSEEKVKDGDNIDETLF